MLKYAIISLFLFANVASLNFQEFKDNLSCGLCKTLVNPLINIQRSVGRSTNLIGSAAENICVLFAKQDKNVCKGIIQLNLPIFLELVDSGRKLNSNKLCSLLLQKKGCISESIWSVPIPQGETVPRKDASNPESIFKILYLSDIHFDPLYMPGKLKDCGEPLCCRRDQKDGSISNGTACGYWSEYQNGDTSEALVNETIRKASEFEFDYIYLTGDIVGHQIWATSVENNTRDLKNIFGKLKRVFKGKPIYLALGNHEPSPTNQFSIGNASSGVSTEWLYELMISEFSEWLPESARKDIMTGGYYAVSPRKGLRIISLNDNVAMSQNWWLIRNETDPYDQLAWLAKTLKKSEDDGEIVHILAHIPSGKSELSKVWSQVYHQIIERFSNTVAAQFYGHTHKDQFVAYYNSSNTSQVINVALNGASVMSDQSNPVFKFVSIDNKNFDVIDTEGYTFNLTEANLNPAVTPNWYRLSSFRETFGVKSLIPSEFSELLPRMATNHKLLDAYHNLKYRYSDPGEQMGCDDNCRKSYLCEMATSLVGDSTQCDRLKELYDQNNIKS